VKTLTALIKALSMPLVILNVVGGIGSGICLAVLRDWHGILLGTACFFVSTVAFGWVFIPSTLLAMPAAYFYEKRIAVGFVCFSALASLYSYTVITLWCCGVLFVFVGDATANALVPRLVWSYGIAIEPFAYMAYKEYVAGTEGTASQLATFFAQLAYLIIMLLVVFSPISLRGVIKVFGVFMLLSFVVQISAAIRIQWAETD
jgi:hypothetical protein